jgi:hypothetical protein
MRIASSNFKSSNEWKFDFPASRETSERDEYSPEFHIGKVVMDAVSRSAD